MNKHETELKELFIQANRCSVELPSELARKIELLTQAQIIIGRLAADSVREYKRIYAERKRVFAEAYLKAERHREQMAELAVIELRQKEAEFESDKVRWNNAFESNLEVINSLKYSLKVLIAEYQSSANGSR